MAEYAVDFLPVGFFVLDWPVYAYTLERTSYGCQPEIKRAKIKCASRFRS